MSRVQKVELLKAAIRRNKTIEALSLIKKGALIGQNLNSLLDLAIDKNNHKIVKMIIDYGIQDNPSVNLIIAFQKALSKRNSMMVEAIIPHCGFSKPSDLYIPKELIEKSDPQAKECVEHMLKWNFTIHPDNYHDKEFIYAAVKEGHLSIVIQLLDHGINVNMVNLKTRLNLLTIACLNGHHEIVEKLLEHNAEVNMRISVKNKRWNNHSYFNYRMHELSIPFVLNDPRINPELEMIESLLYGNADVNYPTDNFETPLSMACQGGNLQIVKALLNKGANPHAVNREGQTPLHLVCTSLSDTAVNIIELLLEHGADVEAVDNCNWTPLMFACKSNNYKTIEFLLEHHANPNHADTEKLTPLHVAVEGASVYRNDVYEIHPSVQLLIKHGANVDVMEKTNRTPFHYAIERMIFYDEDNSQGLFFVKEDYGVVLKILISQSIRLKTAGLELNYHLSNVTFNPDDCIIIDNMMYSANDILRLDLASHSYDDRAERVFYGMDPIGDIQKLQAKCEQELEQMKKERIGFDDLTLHDLLEGNIYRLSNFFDDDEIQQILETEVYEKKFPLYLDIVKNRLKEAKIRYELYVMRMSAREYFLLNIYERLPYECIDEVLNYLNDKEIKTFVEAMESVNIG